MRRRSTTPNTTRSFASWKRSRASIPDWRSRRLWQLGTLQASASLIYFGGNTFIPDYLHATNQPELLGAALTALNGGQVPASLAAFTDRLALHAWRITEDEIAALKASGLSEEHVYERYRALIKKRADDAHKK